MNSHIWYATLRTTDGVLNKVTGLRSGEMCFGGEDSEGERFCFWSHTTSRVDLETHSNEADFA